MSAEQGSATTPACRIEPSIGELARSMRMLVVPTSADDEAYARCRRAALQLARSHDVCVVLYDRSDERWTDTPHPEGPLRLDEVDPEQRPHLVRQMHEFADAGVDVRAWYSSVPALTEILAAVQHLGADAVLLPDELDKPRVMDRLQPGDDAGEMVARVLDQHLEQPVHVLVLADDCGVDVITTVDRTDRSQAAPSEVE